MAGLTEPSLMLDVREVATGLFAARGFRSTTISEIARRANVGKGSVYLHWDSKDDLYVDCVDSDSRLAYDEIRESVCVDPTLARLRDMVGLVIDSSLRHPLARALVLHESLAMSGLAPTAREALAELRCQVLSLWHAYLGALLATEALHPSTSTDAVTRCTSALLRGLVELPGGCGADGGPFEAATKSAIQDMLARAHEAEHIPCLRSTAETVQRLACWA